MADTDNSLVIRAAALLMIVQVLSRILGYARDVVLLNLFGQSYVTDAFNAAFSIPDFIYNILIGGAIASAFIPVFCYYMTRGEKKEAWKVSNIFTTWAMMLFLVGAVVAFIWTEDLLSLITSFRPEQMYLPVFLTRITLVQALFMALGSIATGILQAHNHFLWPAVGTLLYNTFIILGGWLLAGPIEARWPGYGIAGFSIGVVVGSLLMLIVQVPKLMKLGYTYRPMLDVHHPGLHQLVKLMIPVLIGLSVSQINVLVTQYLATGLEAGVYTALRTANRFMQLPLGIFATSISVAVFPTMTAQAAAGDYPAMKRSLSLGLRTILFISLPSAVGLIMLRVPTIRLLYEFSGEFTPADTQICASALLFYCLGLVGYAAVYALIRAFYALKDTKTPVLVSCAAIAVNIGMSALLIKPMDYQGLALAYSLSGLTQALLLILTLGKRIGGLFDKGFARSMTGTAIACAIMAVIVWLTAGAIESAFGVDSKLWQLIQVMVSLGVGVLSFFAAAWLMKMEELQQIMAIVRRKLKRK